MTTAFDKWFEGFYKDWDYSKERLTLQDKLRYAYLAGHAAGLEEQRQRDAEIALSCWGNGQSIASAIENDSLRATERGGREE